MNSMSPLADFSSDVGPVMAMLIMVMIPVVAILAKHQQKMAMILRQPVAGSRDDVVMHLAAEVRQLREIVNQQTLALDSIAETNRRLAATLEPKTIEDRLSV